MMLQLFHWCLDHTPATMNQSRFCSRNHSKSRPPTGDFAFVSGRDVTQNGQSFVILFQLLIQSFQVLWLIRRRSMEVILQKYKYLLSISAFVGRR